jgi:hypothetical protein
MACVVDEATKETIGIVTLEDIIEELIQEEILDEEDLAEEYAAKARKVLHQAKMYRRGLAFGSVAHKGYLSKSPPPISVEPSSSAPPTTHIKSALSKSRDNLKANSPLNRPNSLQASQEYRKGYQDQASPIDRAPIEIKKPKIKGSGKLNVNVKDHTELDIYDSKIDDGKT